MKDIIALYALSIWFEPAIVKAGAVGIVIAVWTGLTVVFLRYPPEDAL